MTPPVTVIGLGTPYRRDDGAAAAVLVRLAPLVDRAEVRLVELDGEPVRIVHAWEGSRAVWLVDAVRSGRPGGTFGEVPVDRLRGDGERRTQLGGGHSLGVGDALDLARALDLLPASISFLGIEGVDFGPGVGLSAEVDAGCSAAAAHLADSIERHLVVRSASNRRGALHG